VPGHLPASGCRQATTRQKLSNSEKQRQFLFGYLPVSKVIRPSEMEEPPEVGW
jgi:hypothetical protein